MYTKYISYHPLTSSYVWLVPFNYLTEQDHSSDFVKGTFKIIREKTGEPPPHEPSCVEHTTCKEKERGKKGREKVVDQRKEH